MDMSTEDPRQLSLIHRRLVSSSADIMGASPEEITYQHTVLCQTCLPYRNQGAQTVWEKEQGRVALRVEAGAARNPDTQEWTQLGLPFGAKPRLVLMHLNAQAIKTQSPTIEVEDSMTAFARNVLGYAPNGKEIKLMKDQLGRLSAALIRLAVNGEARAFQVDTKIVTAFDLWFPKDERQRVLWPSTVRLSEEYFQSLSQHAVPLDERAITALSHSAMGLDIYAWLAQRLHRIEFGKSQFVPWKSLKDQFGWGYKRMNHFRPAFLKALTQVHSQYRSARIGVDDRGMTLHHSPPPIQGRIATVPLLPKR
jgi:hypothetical protein